MLLIVLNALGGGVSMVLVCIYVTAGMMCGYFFSVYLFANEYFETLHLPLWLVIGPWFLLILFALHDTFKPQACGKCQRGTFI